MIGSPAPAHKPTRTAEEVRQMWRGWPAGASEPSGSSGHTWPLAPLVRMDQVRSKPFLC